MALCKLWVEAEEEEDEEEDELGMSPVPSPIILQKNQVGRRHLNRLLLPLYLITQILISRINILIKFPISIID